MVGPYLGEILRTTIGGEWERSADGVLSLRIDRSLYAPVEKVRKFASDSQNGDSLTFYAQAILATHAQPGAPANAPKAARR